MTSIKKIKERHKQEEQERLKKELRKRLTEESLQASYDRGDGTDTDDLEFIVGGQKVWIWSAPRPADADEWYWTDNTISAALEDTRSEVEVEEDSMNFNYYEKGRSSYEK